jgi:soluble lytic murein transglycosylase
MPVVPLEENRVGIASATDAKFQPADYSGTGAQALGAGLEEVGQAGQHAAKYLEAQQKIYDDAAVKQQYNQLVEQSRPILRTGPDAFYTRSGRDAVEAFDPTAKALASLKDSLKDGLRSPRQRLAFEEIAQRRIGEELDSASAYTTAQQRVWLSQQTEGVKANSANDALDNVGNDKFGEYVATGLRAIDDQAEHEGWAPDYKKAAEAAYVSNIHTRAIDRQATVDPVGAAAYYQQHKREMTPGDAAAVEKGLHGPLMEREAAAVVDGYPGAASGATPQAPAAIPGGGSQTARMVAITLHSESHGNDYAPGGGLLTSSAGAQGRMQVMPGTNRDPGFGVTPAKDDGVEERARVGRDYLAALMKHYGNDPAKAWAAYNGGPGNLDAAIKAKGENYLSVMRRETQDYVHKNIAMLGGAAGTQTYAPRRDDLNGLYQYIERQNLPFDVKQAALAEADKRVARDDRLLNRQQEDAKDAALDVVNRIPPGEFTSLGQIPPAIARNLSPEFTHSLIDQAAENAKELAAKTADLNIYKAMIATPGFTFNPFDEQQKKGVEAAVSAMGGSPQAALDVWQRTGILAKSGAVALRGGLVSTDATHVAAAANVAANMVRRNPNAFAGIDGGEDMERAAFAFNHYTYDLGYSPAQAAARIAKENAPDFRAKVKLGQPEIAAYRKQLHDTGGDDATAALGAAFDTADRKAEANQSYAELTIENMQKGYDVATAQGIAARQLHKVYSVSRDGLLHKFAPEGGYPPINGSFDYIYRDAATTVKTETGHEVDPSRVRLIPIPGVTDDDFRNGRPARYRILYGYRHDGQFVQDIVHGEFAADVQAAAASTTAHRAESFGEKQVRLRALQAELEHDAAMPLKPHRGADY